MGSHPVCGRPLYGWASLGERRRSKVRSSRFGWIRVAVCAIALLPAALEPIAAQEEGDTGGQRFLAAQSPELVTRLFEKRTLLLEEVERADGGTLFVAYVLFDQPRSRVVALLTEPGRQREYRPELCKVKVIESGENTRLDENQLKVMFTKLVYRVRYVSELDQEPQRLSWKLDPSFDNDVTRLEGSWELYELDAENTVGRFGSIVDVGAVPQIVQDILSRKTVVNTVENTRYWVDSDGKWRP